jgi:hypothetical protein
MEVNSQLQFITERRGHYQDHNNVDDRMINEYGAVDGMRIGRGNK